jgi:hypothetical protein
MWGGKEKLSAKSLKLLAVTQWGLLVAYHHQGRKSQPDHAIPTIMCGGLADTSDALYAGKERECKMTDTIVAILENVCYAISVILDAIGFRRKKGKEM